MGSVIESGFCELLVLFSSSGVRACCVVVLSNIVLMCILSLSYVYPTYILRVSYVYPTYILRVSYVYPTCILRVSYVCLMYVLLYSVVFGGVSFVFRLVNLCGCVVCNSVWCIVFSVSLV